MVAHQICPGLNANEIQIPYDKLHKVSSLVKSHLNTHNLVKYEVSVTYCLVLSIYTVEVRTLQEIKDRMTSRLRCFCFYCSVPPRTTESVTRKIETKKLSMSTTDKPVVHGDHSKEGKKKITVLAFPLNIVKCFASVFSSKQSCLHFKCTFRVTFSILLCYTLQFLDDRLKRC